MICTKNDSLGFGGAEVSDIIFYGNSRMDGRREGGKGGVGGSAPHEHAPDISHIIIERLQRENEKLREQRRKSLMIEITGKGGLPVYATGTIDHGKWRFAYGGLWDAPDLEMTDAFKDEDGGDVISISFAGY